MNVHTTREEPVSKQRIGKYTRIGILLEKVFSVGPPRGYITTIAGQLRGELSESLEAAVEGDGEEKTECII
jgi:hypothetical protein